MFKPAGSLLGGGEGGSVGFRHYILNNSVAAVINDIVTLGTDNSAVILGTAGVRLLGVVRGFVKDSGSPITTSGVGTAAFTNAYTAASDNLTVSKVRVVVQVSPFYIYSGDADAALNTTAGSDQSGYVVDIADEDEIDESSVVLASTTTNSAQLFSWGPDPADSGNMIVNIFESLFRGN